MTWICDICGYENEYDQSSKHHICVCCHEEIPEEKLNEFLSEMKNEQKRIAREKNADRIRIVKTFFSSLLVKTNKALKKSKAAAVYLLLAVCLLSAAYPIFFFVAEKQKNPDQTILSDNIEAQWNKTGKAMNLSLISDSYHEKMGNFKSNTAETFESAKTRFQNKMKEFWSHSYVPGTLGFGE